MSNKSESLWTTKALGQGWELQTAAGDMYPPRLDSPEALIQFREGGDMDIHVDHDPDWSQTQLTVPGFAMSALVTEFGAFMARREAK